MSRTAQVKPELLVPPKKSLHSNCVHGGLRGSKQLKESLSIASLRSRQSRDSSQDQEPKKAQNADIIVREKATAQLVVEMEKPASKEQTPTHKDQLEASFASAKKKRDARAAAEEALLNLDSRRVAMRVRDSRDSVDSGWDGENRD